MARHRYTDLEAGAYRLTASASAGSEDLGKGTGVFVVESRTLELSRGLLIPNTFFWMVTLIAASVYLADVRPAVREISGGSRW